MKFSRVYQGTCVVLIILYSLIYGLDVSYNYVKHISGCVVDKYIFLRLLQPTLDQCVIECVRRPGCLAANFRRRFTLCYLVNINNISELEWSTTEKDCVFVNKSDMHYIIPSSFDTCDVGQSLDLENGKCSKTECPKLSVGNGTVLGNMKGIGNRAKYTCNPGFKREPDDPYTICQPNGTWSITPKCVKEPCERDWVPYNVSCYMFGTRNQNLTEANKECLNLGAHLVNINDASENDFIKKHLARNDTPAYGGNFWLGLTAVQSQQPRTWQGIDTNTTATFFDWGPFQGSTSNEYCVVLYKGNNAYAWYDFVCTTLFQSLCKQTFYLIDESESAGKGANSVVSMVDHYLKNYGLGERHAQFHFDNCRGQNKNNVVVWYALWRVLLGLHDSIEMSCMIAGHTKFEPDWHFGIWKCHWKNSNAETLKDVANTVQRSSRNGHNIPQLVGDPDKPVVFSDWKKFLVQYFKPVKNITTYHHFSVCASDPGVVTLKENANAAAVKVKLLRKDLNYTEMPEKLVIPGLDPHRQWYLYEQIREFCLTEEGKDVTCPKPQPISANQMLEI